MFEGINWIMVVVAALAWFALGAVWYSFLFGKAWARLLGIDEDNPGGNVALIFGLTFVLEIVACATLASLMAMGHAEGWRAGLHYGLCTGLGFVAPATAINYLFQRRSVALIAIDAGHMALGLAVAGTILGAFS